LRFGLLAYDSQHPALDTILTNAPGDTIASLHLLDVGTAGYNGDFAGYDMLLFPLAFPFRWTIINACVGQVPISGSTFLPPRVPGPEKVCNLTR